MKSIYEMDISELMDLLAFNIDTLNEKTSKTDENNVNNLLKYLNNKLYGASRLLTELDLISEKLSTEMTDKAVKKSKITTESTEFITRVKKDIKHVNTIAALEFISDKSFLKELGDLSKIIDDFVMELGGFIEKVRLLIKKVEKEKKHLPPKIIFDDSYKPPLKRNELLDHVEKFIRENEKRLNLEQRKTLNSLQLREIEKYCNENNLPNVDSFIQKMKTLGYKRKQHRAK